MTDVAGYFALVIGLFAVVSAGLLFAKVLRARSFVPVPARIIEKSIDEASVPTAAGDSGGPRYEARVRYAYAVNGTEFIGDRLGLYRTTYLRGAAKKHVSRLPDTVTVFVDPKNPATSVLSRQGLGLALLVGGFGAFVVIIALAVILA
ncbi:DUF3592 domain-containing protein [Mycobacterium sp. NPDC051804]|uniref:DUF3592 domain-containing protein n=1 Tax=Mycobacterium sp. NPDC051804 TaxID=3364295 RepID=UPI0037B7863B